jgi:hypothetical protein
MINSQQQISGATTSNTPAATTNGDNYLLAWRSDTDQSIYWATCPASQNQDSYDWGQQEQIPNVASSGAPALANLKGTVWMAWKGENADTRIFISSLSGSTWSPGVPVSGIGTNATPALASNGSELFLGWMGESDNSIYWSKSPDGKAWSAAATVPGALTTDTPALAGYNGNVYLAYKGGGVNDTTLWWTSWTEAGGWAASASLFVSETLSNVGPALGVGDTGTVHLALKQGTQIWTAIWTPADRQWSPISIIPVVATDMRPALASQGSAATDVLLAWKGAAQSGVWAGPFDALVSQPVTYAFSVSQINIITQRSRNSESDTLYMTISVAVGSKPTVKKTFSLGDHHYGDVFNSPDWSVQAAVADDEKVVMSYIIINHGGSSSSTDIMSTLESTGDTLAKSAIAVYATEVSIVAGAALNVVLPGFGVVLVPILDSALIALGDWLLSDVVGLISLITPDCDGPVATGVHAYTGSQLRKGIDANQFSHTYAMDNCVGVNSPAGCGDNSLYDVDWNISGQYP